MSSKCGTNPRIIDYAGERVQGVESEQVISIDTQRPMGEHPALLRAGDASYSDATNPASTQFVRTNYVHGPLAQRGLDKTLGLTV